MAQSSITLTASMRSNLSSLKSIQKQMDITQERLSTGKKVNSAIDNASSYYQSRALTNRASDLESLLDSMGQGIQTIQAANEGIESVTAYVEQLKSVANSAFALDSTLSSYEDTVEGYRKQFDAIQTEITKLVADASYQGINLLRGNKLTVTFNESRSNKFDVQGQDIVEKMAITNASDAWKAEAGSEGVKKTDKAITVGAYEGKTYAKDSEVTTRTVEIDAADVTAFKAVDGKWYKLDGTAVDSANFAVFEAADDDADAGTVTKDGGIVIAANAGTSVAAGADIYNVKVGGETVQAVANGGKYYSIEDASELTVANPTTDVKLAADYSKLIDNTLTEISEAVDYLRSFSTELGNNYSIIETRQEFTEAMIDVLETGADNLVLADMNEESANYLALQTRQQLAINSLSLASQSAQSVLSLF